MSKTVDISELAFSVEDFLGPLSGKTQGFGEGTEEFDYLGDMVVVFAVLGAGLGIEEVVTGDEFEDLDSSSQYYASK